MKIAVISDISTVMKNPDVMASLESRGHEIINVGMKSASDPELTYIHTGFLSALVLNAKRADLVVGGCGTGQGFMNSVNQYPGVACGHLITPLDAWLFTQINAGNCLSIMLNEGWGWGGEVNLKLLFDAFFSVELGGGYPAPRAESQANSRALLKRVSETTHRPFAEIVRSLEDYVVQAPLAFPGVWELIDPPTLENRDLAVALEERRQN